jgi:CheY-like chemotaxis protein
MDKPRILIVDDEKNIRLTLSQALEVLEVETDTAANGEEALAKLKEKEFCLILLDLKMPGMDGMEVLRRLREIRPDIRILLGKRRGAGICCFFALPPTRPSSRC